MASNNHSRLLRLGIKGRWILPLAAAGTEGFESRFFRQVLTIDKESDLRLEFQSPLSSPID